MDAKDEELICPLKKEGGEKEPEKLVCSCPLKNEDCDDSCCIKTNDSGDLVCLRKPSTCEVHADDEKTEDEDKTLESGDDVCCLKKKVVKAASKLEKKEGVAEGEKELDQLCELKKLGLEDEEIPVRDASEEVCCLRK